MSHVPPAQPLHPRRVPSSRSIINRDRRLCSDHKARALHVHGAYSHQLVPSILSTAVSSELRPATSPFVPPSGVLVLSPVPHPHRRSARGELRNPPRLVQPRLSPRIPGAGCGISRRSGGHAREENGLIRAAVHGGVRSVSPSTQPTWLNFALKPVWRRCGSCERRWTASGKCSLSL